jgi:hypothetical protein
MLAAFVFPLLGAFSNASVRPSPRELSEEELTPSSRVGPRGQMLVIHADTIGREGYRNFSRSSGIKALCVRRSFENVRQAESALADPGLGAGLFPNDSSDSRESRGSSFGWPPFTILYGPSPYNAWQ